MDAEQQRHQKEVEEARKKAEETQKKLEERYVKKYDETIDKAISEYEQKAWDELDSRFKSVDTRATDKRRYDFPYSSAQIDVFKSKSRSSSRFMPWCQVSIYRKEFNDFYPFGGVFVSSINISNGFGRVGTADIELTTTDELFKHFNLFDDRSALGRHIKTRWTEMQIILGYGNVYFVVFKGYLVSYEMSADGESKVKVRFSCVNRLAELDNPTARRLGFKSPGEEDTDQEPDENAEDPTSSSTGVPNPNVKNEGALPTTPQEKQQIDISKLSSLQSVPTPSFWIMYEDLLKAHVDEETYPTDKRILSAYKLFTTWVGANRHDVQMVFAVKYQTKSELIHLNLSKQRLIRRIDLGGKFYFGQFSYDEFSDVYIYRDTNSGLYQYGYMGTSYGTFENDFWAIIKPSGSIFTQGKLLDESTTLSSSQHKFNAFNNHHVSDYDWNRTYGMPFRDYFYGKYSVAHQFYFNVTEYDATPLKVEEKKIEIEDSTDWFETGDLPHMSLLSNGSHRTTTEWLFAQGLGLYQMTVEGYKLKLFMGGGSKKMKLVSSIDIDKKWWNELIYAIPPTEMDDELRSEALFVDPKKTSKDYPRRYTESPYLVRSTGVGHNWFLYFGPFLIHLDFRQKKVNVSRIPEEITKARGLTYMFTSKKEMMFVTSDRLFSKDYVYQGQYAIVHKMTYEGTPMQASMEQEFAEIVKENPDPTSKTKRSEELREQAEEKVNSSVVSTPKYTPNPKNNGAANGDGYGIYVDNGSGIFFRGSFLPAPTPDYVFEEGVDLLSVSYASDDTIYSKVEVFPGSGAPGFQMRPAAYPGESGEELRLYRPDLTSEEAKQLAIAYMQGNLADTVEIETRYVPLLDVGKTVGVRCNNRLKDDFMGIIKESTISYTDEGVWMTLVLKVYDYRILFEDIIGVNPIQGLLENAEAKGLPLYTGE